MTLDDTKHDLRQGDKFPTDRPVSDSPALRGAIPYPDKAEGRFSLWRLCTCPECEGTGKEAIASRGEGSGHCSECRGEGRVRQELATAGSPEAVGVALVTLAREGEWNDADGDPCQFGLLDRYPECETCEGEGQVPDTSAAMIVSMTETRYRGMPCPECKGSGVKSTGTWLVLPFPATARTASAAGRLLQSRRPK